MCIKRKLLRSIIAISAVAGLAIAAPVSAKLRMVFIDANAEQVKKLNSMGVDVAHVHKQSDGVSFDARYRADVVISKEDEQRLRSAGFSWSEMDANATQAQRAASTLRSFAFSAAAEPETSYFDYDTGGAGLRDQIYQIAEDYPRLAKVHVIGHSLQGREILALNITKNPKKGRHSRKPEVLYVHTMHAREWVSPYVGMRIVRHLLENYGSDARVTEIVNNISFWSIPVQNPDGYQYTHTDERLWRKNLRDNNGDGVITNADGVDLNRNWGGHWDYDDEGASDNPSSNEYRGTAPFSEPENAVLRNFIWDHKFKYIISYHTYSNLILYPLGWQVQTPSLDDPIFVAQSGVDGNASIFDRLMNQHYDPGVSADLYTTNGEFTDWVYESLKIPAYTVELTSGNHPENPDGTPGASYGFEFPDDAAALNTVFEDNLEFALSVIESSRDPGNPVSPVGMPVENMYHDPVTVSWGDEQRIPVLARAKKRGMKLFYQVDNGRVKRGHFYRANGYNYNIESGKYYDRYEAMIRGQQPGSEVTYWIRRKGETLGPYSYTVSGDWGQVLVIAAEDYSSGRNNNPPYDNTTAPNFVDYYTNALDNIGMYYNVWDVDAQAAIPPLTLLCGHEAVVWYTGNDFAARALDNWEGHQGLYLRMRDYMNYCHGKVVVTGQAASYLSTVFAVTDDDFWQYYLGGFVTLASGGQSADEGHPPYDFVGTDGDPIFGGMNFALQGDDSANNQVQAGTFLSTSYFQPHFDINIAGRYDRPGNPFGPTSGDFYVYSQQADLSFKRLGGTYTLPAGNPMLSFNMSYDIEADWDYAFVEIRRTGANDWTTLPEANGRTTQTTGESCPASWVDQIHPHIGNYMDAACNPTGATGDWNAFTGLSGGWQTMEFDLSAYAGEEVELYISYASDWGTQNLGIFIDDVDIPGQGMNDLEAGLGSLTVSTEAGSPAPANNWDRIMPDDFPEGPALRTHNSVYLGFGFEAINGAANRAQVMQRLMEYFELY